MANLFSSKLSPSRSSTKGYRAVQSYTELRNMVFNRALDQKGANLEKSSKLLGVLMETGYPEAVATLVALTDGTVSLYFSSGGGIIGTGAHLGPQTARQSFLMMAEQFTKQAQITQDQVLPKPCYTRFYFLIPNGLLTIEAKENELGNGQHPLSPLFHKGHELIAAIRTVDELSRAKM